MTKYEYIIAENIEETVSKEINLWRAVIMQHLADLSSDADKKSRCAGFRRAAFKWIFGQDLKCDDVNIDRVLANMDGKSNRHFREVCELAHFNAESVIRQAVAILEGKNSLI